MGCQAAALDSEIRKGPEAGPPTSDVFHTTGVSAPEVKAARMTDVTSDITSEPRESALSDMSGPDNQLAHITHVLQLAVSGQDRGQTPQLLPILLQHLSGSSQQRHLPLATGLQLLQLGAQALNLSAGNLQAQQAGCQVLRAVSQATIGLQEVESDQLQVQHQSLEAVATTMLASQGDRVLQNHGTAAMLALVACDTRPIGPGVYDVNSTDKEGCTVLHRLAKLGLSICLSALIHSCGTQLDFRHKCNGGQTPQMAAEAGQHQMCADILRQAASFGTNTAPAAGQPSRTEAAQAASLILDPRGMFTTQHAQPGHRPEDHQQALPGTMPGLFPLLANMQGQTNAMLHLNMQPAHMYGYNPLPPGLSAPAPFRAGLPTDAASVAASQRASMESASTSRTRPSLDDASMLSRLTSSSLESSFSLNRMSIDDPQHRMSSGSRRSSSWSPYHPLNPHTSPWPSRLASVFSEDPSTASERLSREFEGRMSLEGSRASMDAQSTVSTTACMSHHVTETIAEEEQEELVESQGEEGSWAAAATPATVSVGGEEGGEAGQNWNWAWLAGQLPPEHGTNDPSTLLDDESEGSSKHLWLGNLNTRLPRAVLKAVFEQHGPVDDVVTFPGRMYAFVNFQHAEDAARAQEALDGKEVASLSGGRRLTVRFRPSKRALGKLTEGHPDARDSPAVPQIRDFDVQHSEAGLLQGSRAGEWEGSNTPSNRVWLGNISATATLRSVRSVFSKFGPLTDAAVFPARIGPLGYAFVNFEKVSDASGAYQALNNVVLPALTGCKQLKMRFKPAKANSAELLRGNSQSLEADWEGSLLEASQPSRHLLLGNTSSRPNESALETVFGKFGPLDSVKVFPGKTYALVSFKEVAPAAEAMQCLDGHSLLSVSGQKPLVIRYQSGTATQPSSSATVEGGDASAAALQRRGSLGAADPSDPAKGPPPRTARSLAAAGDEEESEDDLLMPAVNLSNRLNPNNVHFDRQLAAQYKRMSKHEKEALWAADRARQHQLRELTELSQMAGLSATELSQLTELTQAAMLNQTADLSSGLLSQLGNFFQKPPTTPGLPPGQTWEGAVPPAGNFPANNSLAVGSASGSALTGAASGLQAAAQSLLRQRMEALRQQGVGLRGAFAPPSPAPQWEREGQQHQQLQFPQQMPPMGFPSRSQPTGHWPPPQAGFMRGAAPTVPQHMMQRNHNQPPVGPSAMRAPGNQPLGYAAFHQNQQYPFGVRLAQQHQQPLAAQAQAHFQHALDGQARLAADQQLQHHQQQLDPRHSFDQRHSLELQQQQHSLDLRQSLELQQQRQSLEQRHSLDQTQPEQADPQTANTFSSGYDSHLWLANDVLPSAASRAAEQQRQLADLLAASSLHQHDSGVTQQISGLRYQGSQASQEQLHRLTSLAGSGSQDQAHRLTSLGAVSSPEQPYRMTSMGDVHSYEQAYRLHSLGAASSADAMAAFHSSGNQMRSYPSAPMLESTDSGPQGGSMASSHDWGRQL